MKYLVVANQLLQPMRMIMLTNHRKITVGRSPQRDLILADAKVSRLHCVLFREQDTWAIADAKSAGGTYVDGKRVGWKRLTSGRVARVGEFNLWISPEPVEITADVPGASRDAERWSLLAALEKTVGRPGGDVAPKSPEEDLSAYVRPRVRPSTPSSPTAATGERSAFLAGDGDYLPLAAEADDEEPN